MNLPKGRKARLIQFRFPRQGYTEGELFFDNTLVLDTLEDQERDFNGDGDLDDEGEQKVYGETAILRGIYELKVTWSPKFQKMMVLVLGVEHFDGIRYHGGENVDHTDGCVLVGKRNGAGTLTQVNGTQKMIDIVQKCIDEDGYCYVNIL